MSAVTEVDLKLDTGEDSEAVYDTAPLQIMRVRLGPGEELPRHRANSNVLIMPLQGTVAVQESDGLVHPAERGHALSVDRGTRMVVSNTGEALAVFLVLKAPHPKAVSGDG